MKIIIIISTIISLFAIAFLVYGGNSATNFTIYAQSYLQTIKHINLVIDLGNGVKTNAQLTYPAVSKRPVPGVLIPGSGVGDKNETLGFVYNNGPKPFWQIAQYTSEIGFAVFRYDKRGVDWNHTILDTNIWGNATANDLIQDAKQALNVLIQRPKVDSKRISIIGHSEGTIYAPGVAIDNPTKVKHAEIKYSFGHICASGCRSSVLAFQIGHF